MKKKGYALPIAVFTGIFILTMIFILFNIIINQITTSNKNIERVNKEYLFEAAREEGIFEFLSIIQRDIKMTYNVSYKTTSLETIIGQLPNGEGYAIDFLPKQIEYNLEKKGDKFIIKSIKEDVFEIIIKDNKDNQVKNLKVKFEIEDGTISYLIEE